MPDPSEAAHVQTARKLMTELRAVVGDLAADDLREVAILIVRLNDHVGRYAVAAAAAA